MLFTNLRDHIVKAYKLEPIRFALVGLLNTGVDVGIYFAVLFFTNLSAVSANIIAWIVAVTFSYILNSKFTFLKSRNSALTIVRFVKFLIANMSGLLISTPIIYILSSEIGAGFAKVIAILAGFSLNFLMSKYFVFR